MPRRFTFLPSTELFRRAAPGAGRLTESAGAVPHRGLAQNPALPLAIQSVLVKRAAGPVKTCDDCWLHETSDS